MAKPNRLTEQPEKERVKASERDREQKRGVGTSLANEEVKKKITTNFDRLKTKPKQTTESTELLYGQIHMQIRCGLNKTIKTLKAARRREEEERTISIGTKYDEINAKINNKTKRNSAHYRKQRIWANLIEK